jgi:hypothetical protein
VRQRGTGLWTLRKSLRDSRKRPQPLLLLRAGEKLPKTVTHVPGLNCHLSPRPYTPGWRPTWKGWRTPSNAVVQLSRKTHPLLAALGARRPDLKPRLGLAGPVGAALLTCVLGALVPEIGSYLLHAEARRAAGGKRVDDLAVRAFQEGRYLEVCEEYRRALPDLKRDLYGSERAAESLLYCGDRKSALKAAVGYDLQPFWPVAMDPEVLARIRISSASYARISFGDVQATCCT